MKHLTMKHLLTILLTLLASASASGLCLCVTTVCGNGNISGGVEVFGMNERTGISGAVMVLSDVETSLPVAITVTNGLGYFTFGEVQGCRAYTIDVYRKNYAFEGQQVWHRGEDLWLGFFGYQYGQDTKTSARNNNKRRHPTISP